MDIYLKHPVHGTKVACSSLEAEYDEGNGWVRYDPTIALVVTAEPEEVKRPRGRPKKVIQSIEDLTRSDDED